MTFDIRQPILDPRTGEYDEATATRYQDALMAAFAASPEAQTLQQEGVELGWIDPFLTFSMSYLLVTPATMTPRHLDEVLFQLFPRKVSVTPSEAPEIIREVRAFWTFVQR